MVRIAAGGFAADPGKGRRGASLTINSYAVEQVKEANASFTSKGGELIALPPAEHAQMLKTILSVGADVSSKNPALAAAYKIVADAAARTRQSPSQ
jgi:hypothetical protein